MRRRQLEEILEIVDFWNKLTHGLHGNWLSKHEKEKAHRKMLENNPHDPNGWNPYGWHPDMVWGVNNKYQLFYRHGRQGKWSRVMGGTDQVSNGPVGTFQIDKYKNVHYRVGTHEDNNSPGYGWQHLPGQKLSYIAAGLNAVWGVARNARGLYEIFCMSPVVFKGDKVDLSKSKWQKISTGLVQISVAKDSDRIWGVGKTGNVWTKDGLKGRWQYMGSNMQQVEVGNAGVYAVNKQRKIYYRKGTYENPGSTGTGWTKLPGSLKHITVGRDAIWGCNRWNNFYTATVNKVRCTNPQWIKLSGKVKQVSAM